MRLLQLSVLTCSAAMLLAGCVGRGPKSVTNEDPAVKVPLIRQAVARNDRSVLPQLVKDLESDDPAVRFYAVDGLRRMTGQHFGYDWRTDEEARKPAIEKWKQHINAIASTLPAYRPRR